MNKKLIVVMTVLLAVFAFGCRSASTATPDEIDPEVIEASIRTQIATEYPGETFGVGIDVTDEGVVTFTGTVENAEQQYRIPRLAQTVSGVTRIINRLGIKQ